MKKDLAEIFQTDPLHYFGNALVTITHVSVSPDLSFARVFLSVLPIKSAEKVFDRLDELKSEVRKKLGNKIGDRVRIIPELAFIHDDTEERAAKIDSLIDGLNIPPANDEEE